MPFKCLAQLIALVVTVAGLTVWLSAPAISHLEFDGPPRALALASVMALTVAVHLLSRRKRLRTDGRQGRSGQ